MWSCDISQHNLSVCDLGSLPASAGTLTYAATWPHSNTYCASSSWCLLLLPRSKPVGAKLMPQHVVCNHAVHFIDVKYLDYNPQPFTFMYQYININTNHKIIRTIINDGRHRDMYHYHCLYREMYTGKPGKTYVSKWNRREMEKNLQDGFILFNDAVSIADF
jgi:hypothetical protein